MIASAVSASRQFSVNRTPTAIDQPDDRDRRRHDRHLQQSRRRLDVAGEARQDAARLHVPQLRQRQVQQPLNSERRSDSITCMLRMPLAVVLEDAASGSRRR